MTAISIWLWFCILNWIKWKRRPNEANTTHFRSVFLSFFLNFPMAKCVCRFLYIPFFSLLSCSLILPLYARLTLLVAAQNKCVWIEDKTFYFQKLHTVHCTPNAHFLLILIRISYYYISLYPKRKEIKCWGQGMEIFILFLQREKQLNRRIDWWQIHWNCLLMKRFYWMGIALFMNWIDMIST